MCVLETGASAAKTDSTGLSEIEPMPGSLAGGGDPEIKNGDILVKKQEVK